MLLVVPVLFIRYLLARQVVHGFKRIEHIHREHPVLSAGCGSFALMGGYVGNGELQHLH
jgi:hypothetical protein